MTPEVWMFAALLTVGGALETRPGQAPLDVVENVDYARYAGKWFEIARLPNRFERACVSDVTAEYTLRKDGRLTVTNRCREADGSFQEAVGVARPVAGRPPSVLEVRFAPAFLSFLPFVWGDYHIIDLAPDYSHALVGDPERKYLWVLAREPDMDDARLRTILQRAEAQGFDLTPLVRTRHTPAGATPEK